MQAIRGCKFKLYPTPTQCLALAQTAGVVRLIYNLALEQCRVWGGKPYKGNTSRYFSSKGMSGELSALRREFDWIGAVRQTAQNQALVDLDRAFDNFFKNGFGYPSPRKKGRDDAFRHVGREVSIRRLNKKWGEVKVPKIGWIRYRHTRDLPVNPKTQAIDIRSATLRSVPSGGWEISLAVRYDVKPKDTPTAAVGIDRGVTVPYALSNGDMVLLPKTITRRETAIKKTQRNMARKQRGSRRYLKEKRRLNRLLSRNARARSQTAHVLSRRLANSYGMVALENLRIKAMTASARGTVETPGQRVKQKSGLNGYARLWHA